MRYRLKLISCILLGAFLLMLIPLGLLSASSAPVVEAADAILTTAGSDCVAVQLDLKASNTMPVPDFCIDGLCKLILYTDAAMGAFGPGYSWEVYYFQLDGYENRWNGGPNISVGGMEFSDGFGNNGNGIAEGVFLGGTTSDGGYVRIMDDGKTENSPDLWTIESRSSDTLTRASLQACAIPGEVWSGHITESTTIDVPDFCLANLCMILRGTDAALGDFGPGLSLPVYYRQAGQQWVGGPNFSFFGMSFGEALGTNGDASVEYIFEGGTASGGYASLSDDGLESNDDQWTIYFESGDELSEVYFYFAPMDCSSHYITQKYTNISPDACLGSLCTVVRWTDAAFGAWGPGMSWPVNYQQNTATNAWVGGPFMGIGGIAFSDGWGVNGDTSSEKIFDGGRTSDDGYVVLRDDSVTAGETDPLLWNVVFKSTTELTMVNYWVCSNSCQETEFLIYKQYIPLMNR